MATTNANQLAKSGKFGDLRRRLVFLLLALVVYRVGAHIPVPGIDPNQLQQLFKGQANSEGWSVATNNPGTIPLRFAPEWTGNLFVKHSLRDAKEQGWEIKGGVTAVGKLLASLASGHGFAYIPDAQYSFDAGVSYSWRKYHFDFMVTNLTEEPFLITRDQAPRTYRFSVATKF